MQIKIASLLISVLGSSSAHAGLVGTEMSLRTLAQATSSSQPFITSFERRVLVSDSAIEYPNVGSLFNGGQVPPGFAASLVDVAIDVSNSSITIDFENSAPFSRFANGYQNTYIFRFDSAAIVGITGAAIDSAVTTLGLSTSDVTFLGNELFINVEGLSFSTSTLAKIDLLVEGGPPPIPEPSIYLMMLAGIVPVGLAHLRGNRKSRVLPRLRGA